MANKTYSKTQLKTLLQAAQQEVITVLINPTDRNSQYFYQNFATISLKTIKYVNHFLNLLNTDQDLGRLIDALFKNLNDSVREHRSRNIYTHSIYSQQSDHRNEDDQIYHFLNTRNNHIPVQCLNNYESERQRMELQQFVQQMAKHSRFNNKQSKRSLILPKENTFQLKLGRKATLDTELRSIEEETAQNKTDGLLQEPSNPKNCEHVQIQTDFNPKVEEQQARNKTAEKETESQCESIPMFQPSIQNLSNKKSKGLLNKKKSQSKKKPQGEKNKKKGKMANTPSSISFKQSMEILNEHEEEKSQRQEDEKQNIKLAQCSLKTVNPFLALCQKQVDLIVFEYQIAQKIQKIDQDVPALKQSYFVQENQGQTSQTVNNLDKCQEYHFNQIVLESQKIVQSSNSITQTQINKQDQQPETQNQCQIMLQKSVQNLVQNTNFKFNFKNKKIHQANNNNSKNDSNHEKSSNLWSEYQKIPISSVQIIEPNQFQRKNLSNLQYIKPQSEHNTRSNHSMSQNTKKRKTYASYKHSFESNIQQQGPKQSSSQINNIKRPILNMGEQERISKFKKESCRSDNKQSYVAKVEVSNISEATSQDYLVSRQKVNQLDLINRLMEMSKEQNHHESANDPIKEACSNIKDTTAKNSKKNSSIINKQMPLISKQPQNQNLMIIFSSKQKTPQHNGKRSIEIKGLVENDKVLANLVTEKSENIKEHKRSVRSELNSIIEAQKSQQFASLSQLKASTFKKNRTQECRTVDPACNSPKRSIFYNKSSQITPIKASISKLKCDLRNLNSSKSHTKFMNSPSEYSKLGSFEMSELRRKLRNRAYKDKLSQYLELIETTHSKFCGKDCEHITELFTGKEGTVAQQILRLFKKLK